jgi:hypothetical protein
MSLYDLDSFRYQRDYLYGGQQKVSPGNAQEAYIFEKLEKLDRIDKMVSIIFRWYEEQKHEQVMRERSPALQDAWNQYQVVKALVDDQK